MKTEPTTETREPSASALRVARAVADLIRTTEVDVNARPINKDDRAWYRERAVLDAALLIETDRVDLLEALQAIAEFQTKFMRQSEAEKSGGGYRRIGPMEYFGTMFPLVERARNAIANHTHP